MEKSLKIWKGIKNWTHKYVGGLIMKAGPDGINRVSLGRASLLAVLLMMMWCWRKAILGDPTTPLPDGMMPVFMTLCGYELGSKINSTLSKTRKDGTTETFKMGGV